MVFSSLSVDQQTQLLVSTGRPDEPEDPEQFEKSTLSTAAFSESPRVEWLICLGLSG